MVCITNKLNESCKFDGLVKAFWRCANSHWVMPRKLYYSFCPLNWCGVSRVVLSCCGDLSMASSHCILWICFGALTVHRNVCGQWYHFPIPLLRIQNCFFDDGSPDPFMISGIIACLNC